jgi:hypothetical protein
MSDIIDLDCDDISDLLDDECEISEVAPEILNLDSESIFLKFFTGTKNQVNVINILKALEANKVIVRGIYATGVGGSAFVLEALKSDSLSQLLKVRFEARQKCHLNSVKMKKIFNICTGRFRIQIGEQELYFILLKDVVFSSLSYSSSSPQASARTNEHRSFISKEIVSDKSFSILFNETIDIIASTRIIELNHSPIITITRGMRIEKGVILKNSVRVRFLFDHKILVPSLCEFLREKFSCNPVNNEVPMLVPKASLKPVTMSKIQSHVPSDHPNFLNNSKRELGIIKSVSDSLFGNDSRERANLNIGTVNFFLGNHPSSSQSTLTTSSTYSNSRGGIFQRLGRRIDDAQYQRPNRFGNPRGRSSRTYPYLHRDNYSHARRGN